MGRKGLRMGVCLALASAGVGAAGVGSAWAGSGEGEGASPTVILGTVQGCGRSDGGALACDVTSEGWTYHAWEDKPQSRVTLAVIDALPAGQTVELTGRVVSEGDISRDMVLESVKVFEGEGLQERLANLLVGAWRSRDDDQSVRRFESDGRVFDYYAGDQVAGGGFFEIADACPSGGPEGAGPILVVQEFGETDPFCYAILGLDRTSLDLSYLGRGNTLRYERDGF
ncbi:hypothetical protein [Rhodospirillum sp. A1_3_36]|uniref:hypothetical protein n=1 Tax=Rhodospirillum sp. A1_3_36 TaxID=3391666 RepID=UPI0039A5EFA8